VWPAKFVLLISDSTFYAETLQTAMRKALGSIPGSGKDFDVAFCFVVVTGYRQRVTGCGFKRRQCSCYSKKTHINSVILILKLNLTSMRNIYIFMLILIYSSAIAKRLVILTVFTLNRSLQIYRIQRVYYFECNLREERSYTRSKEASTGKPRNAG